ncbi:hypothetical protein QYE76_036631 [Lolium multiflorum]|uniref:F-box/LRR-repeat protein 15/At3g58940/PEG3-like LRR domain-containing protein n=1 Tax=Lolium multiflorum TaxID=4521 RepID=A0AAD8R595_LOLMU|nr:hypothetical protein QYE76_036631 [Lolium multiflorum]
METQAGGPGSGAKKRKRHAMRTKQGGRGPGSVSKKRKPAPVATPAAAEVRAASDQGPPPGSDVNTHAAGRISLIPDAILGEIVSLLSTKEGARTELLASRWRHIWRSAPLNLDCGSLIKVDCAGGEATRNSDHDGVVSRILTSHQAPVRRLCIPTGPTAEACWLQSPTLDNLEQLEFSYLQDCGPARSSWDDRMLPVPPPCTFRFAATLRLASIGKCHLPDSIVHGLHFPQLKHLRLHSVCISEWSIHHMIAGCPTIECLMIYFVFGVNRLKINALRLRIIGMHTYSHDYYSTAEPRLENLVIENAPCLTRLIRADQFDATRVSVISAPKLETFGYVNNDHPSFSWNIKRLRDDSMTMAAQLVKTLGVRMSVLDLDKVIGLMRCFPCLENLYIQNESMLVVGSRPKNYWRRKHRNLIGCLDICLKKIVLETYRGTLFEVNFVQFFVLKARELELMRIQVETMEEEFIAKQEKLLQLENKASRGYHEKEDQIEVEEKEWKLHEEIAEVWAVMRMVRTPPHQQHLDSRT